MAISLSDKAMTCMSSWALSSSSGVISGTGAREMGWPIELCGGGWLNEDGCKEEPGTEWKFQLLRHRSRNSEFSLHFIAAVCLFHR